MRKSTTNDFSQKFTKIWFKNWNLMHLFANHNKISFNCCFFNQLFPYYSWYYRKIFGIIARFLFISGTLPLFNSSGVGERWRKVVGIEVITNFSSSWKSTIWILIRRPVVRWYFTPKKFGKRWVEILAKPNFSSRRIQGQNFQV